jgi:hypothetical protein
VDVGFGVAVEVAAGGGVLVGGTDVLVAAAAVLVAGTGVLVAATAVFVAGTAVLVATAGGAWLMAASPLSVPSPVGPSYDAVLMHMMLLGHKPFCPEITSCELDEPMFP